MTVGNLVLVNHTEFHLNRSLGLGAVSFELTVKIKLFCSYRHRFKTHQEDVQNCLLGYTAV
jgi:hypothetical protein